ncbi:hypothetical protein QOT17_008732 [Balamuthia mandrillaris]
MPYCYQCGSSVPTGAAFCSQCGAKQQQQQPSSGGASVCHICHKPFYGPPVLVGSLPSSSSSSSCSSSSSSYDSTSSPSYDFLCYAHKDGEQACRRCNEEMEAAIATALSGAQRHFGTDDSFVPPPQQQRPSHHHQTNTTATKAAGAAHYQPQPQQPQPQQQRMTTPATAPTYATATTTEHGAACCGKCGAELPPRPRFCNECGTLVK